MKAGNVVLAGISGYGRNYLKLLLDGEGGDAWQLAGVVDPYPENCKLLDEIKHRNITIYESLEQFYEASEAELAIIASPIQFHCLQTCLALSHGSNVLCEKPLSATWEEAEQIVEARNRSGKFVAVGYQWSYSQAIQELKRDIAQGVLGKPIRFKTLALWPRSREYFSKSWAGKIKDNYGRWVNDSVANNATAHFLHNMFYVLGHAADQSARPSRLTAELYRANAIENYDTAALRVFTEDGVELLYYSSHPVDELVGVQFRYEFEQAVVTYDALGDKQITASFHDGRQKKYGDPDADKLSKLRISLAAAGGEGSVLCGPEAAMSHTACIQGMPLSSLGIRDFPQSELRVNEEDDVVYVRGLVGDLRACYDQAVLPAEAGCSWASKSKEIQL